MSPQPGEGTPEVVRDRETGILIPPADVHALRSVLEELINSPGMRRKLVQDARAALGSFNSSTSNAKTEEVLVSLRRN